MSDQKPFCPSHPNPLCPMKEGKGRCHVCGYDFSAQKLDRESRNTFWEQARQEGEQKKVSAQQPNERPQDKDTEAGSRRKSDEFAWLKAASRHNEAAYELYLERYADGTYQEEAVKRIADLKAAAEARCKADEEAKRKVDTDAKRKAEEEAKRKADADAKRKAEEEAKRKADADAKRKAEEEAKRKADADAKRKAEEEAKRKVDADVKRKAEEEAKRKADADVKRKAEEEAKRKADADAKRKAEEEAKREVDEADWQKAKSADSASEYSTYLNGHADGKYRSKAISRKIELQAQERLEADAAAQVLRVKEKEKTDAEARAQADETDWLKAKSIDTATGYSAYLNDHADGKYRSNAISRKMELQAQERLEANAAAQVLRVKEKEKTDAEVRAQADETDWLKAKSVDTAIGYSAYLNDHADGKYRSRAISRKVELQAQERLEADAAAQVLRVKEKEKADAEARVQSDEADWLIAKSRNTLQEYRGYIDKYQDGFHRHDALRRIKEINNDSSSFFMAMSAVPATIVCDKLIQADISTTRAVVVFVIVLAAAKYIYTLYKINSCDGEK